MPISVYQDGQDSKIVSTYTAFKRLAADHDPGDVSLRLARREEVHTILRDGSAAILTFVGSLRDNPEIPETASPPSLPLHDWQADCIVHVELPCQISCQAPNADSVAEQIQGTMRGRLEPSPEFRIDIHDDDIQALCDRITYMRDPVHLGATCVIIEQVRQQHLLGEPAATLLTAVASP